MSLFAPGFRVASKSLLGHIEGDVWPCNIAIAGTTGPLPFSVKSPRSILGVISYEIPVSISQLVSLLT